MPSFQYMVRKILETPEFNQESLAEFSGTTQTTISQLKNGYVEKPRNPHVAEMIEVLYEEFYGD